MLRESWSAQTPGVSSRRQATAAQEVGFDFPIDGGVREHQGSRYLQAGDRTVRIWDALTGKPVARFPLPPNMGFNAAGFSSDGRRLLVGTVLCEPVTGRKVAELGNYLSQGSSFERFEFSLDGLVVAFERQ